jgi:hypothetical protein
MNANERGFGINNLSLADRFMYAAEKGVSQCKGLAPSSHIET